MTAFSALVHMVIGLALGWALVISLGLNAIAP